MPVMLLPKFRSTLFAFIVLILGSQLVNSQEIIVDPDNVGATDVAELDLFTGVLTPITNPVSSPLDLGDDRLLIGTSVGRGELLIRSGGILLAGEVIQANGATTIAGVGSRLESSGDLVVGKTDADSFDSDLYVLEGGVVEAADVVIGFDLLLDDGSTTITVDGPGSQLISNGQRITVGLGNGSRATLNVLRGANVSASELIIGATLPDSNALSISDVVVDGTGSVLTADFIQAGGYGTRELFVSNGGRVETQNLLLGTFNGLGPNGGANVSSGGILHIETEFTLMIPELQFIGGTLSLGGDRAYNGFPGTTGLNAVLEPRGGSLTTGETLKIEGNLDAESTISIVGGSLSAGSITGLQNVDLMLGRLELRNMELDVSTGSNLGNLISLSAGQELAVLPGVNVASDAMIELDGGIIETSEMVNDGILRLAGGSFSELFGDLEMEPDSQLSVEIQSDGSGQMGILGSAELAGELVVELPAGFTPFQTTLYNVMYAGQLTGQFDNVASGERVNTAVGSFLVHYGTGSPYGSQQVVLSDFQAGGLLGDVNNDGEVNLLDVAPFVDALTSGTFVPAADINGDGVVNLLDVQPFVTLLTG